MGGKDRAMSVKARSLSEGGLLFRLSFIDRATVSGAALTSQSSFVRLNRSAAMRRGAELEVLEALQDERPTERDHKSRRLEWGTTSFNG